MPLHVSFCELRALPQLDIMLRSESFTLKFDGSEDKH